jgi:hypothetical protein
MLIGPIVQASGIPTGTGSQVMVLPPSAGSIAGGHLLGDNWIFCFCLPTQAMVSGCLPPGMEEG